MSHHHHAIDYVELSASHLAAARAFYSAAFGWTFNDYGPEYAGIQGSDPGWPEAGGLAVNGPPNPLVILYSNDLDATAEAVVSAGGRIVNGPYDFPGGRRFHFTDPTGNELAVWSPGSSAH